MTASNFVGSLGRGLAAGLFGTVVMTVAQMIEMRLEGRPPSLAPAKAVENTLSIRPKSERAEKRLNQLTHFAYGTSWGMVRGLLGTTKMRSSLATPIHLLLVWSAALVMLPRLGLAPPVREWSKTELAQDLGMHAIYAFATGAAFERLERRA